MKILETEEGVVLEAHVRPQSGRFHIQVTHELVVFCRQPPVKNKVNRELIKELSRIFRSQVEIVFGFQSKTKRILIKGVTEKEVLETLETIKE